MRSLKCYLDTTWQYIRAISRCAIECYAAHVTSHRRIFKLFVKLLRLQNMALHTLLYGQNMAVRANIDIPLHHYKN